MPLYEYQCLACGHRTEQLQSFSGPPLAACPVCGGAVKKLPSAPSVQFKGSGWYATDYAKKSAETKSDGKPAEKSDGGGDSSSASPVADKPSSTTESPAAKPAATDSAKS
jgi:putative FmdB family regulatory protein